MRLQHIEKIPFLTQMMAAALHYTYHATAELLQHKDK